MDGFIWWEPRFGKANIWEDDWTELRVIKVTNLKIIRAIIIEDLSVFMTPKRWDRDELQQYLP